MLIYLFISRIALHLAEKEHPSLAVEFLVKKELKGKRCDIVPGLFSIKHNNNYWQIAEAGSSTFLLYGAYDDQRDLKG